jgi:hypothetical protein
MNIVVGCSLDTTFPQTSAIGRNWTRSTPVSSVARTGVSRHTELMREGRTRVQDDSRERQIAMLCALMLSDKRDGPDAFDASGNPFEIKSATKQGITTARDVGLHTIEVWRSKYWIIAAGENLTSGFRIDGLWVCHPDDLESRFRHIESDLAASWDKCQQVLDAARRLGTDETILSEVQDRLQRGITKNNPKIPLHVVTRNGLLLPHKNPRQIPATLQDFTRRRPLTVRSQNQTVQRPHDPS